MKVIRKENRMKLLQRKTKENKIGQFIHVHVLKKLPGIKAVAINLLSSLKFYTYPALSLPVRPPRRMITRKKGLHLHVFLPHFLKIKKLTRTNRMSNFNFTLSSLPSFNLFLSSFGVFFRPSPPTRRLNIRTDGVRRPVLPL